MSQSTVLKQSHIITTHLSVLIVCAYTHTYIYIYVYFIFILTYKYRPIKYTNY